MDQVSCHVCRSFTPQFFFQLSSPQHPTDTPHSTRRARHALPTLSACRRSRPQRSPHEHAFPVARRYAPPRIHAATEFPDAAADGPRTWNAGYGAEYESTARWRAVWTTWWRAVRWDGEGGGIGRYVDGVRVLALALVNTVGFLLIVHKRVFWEAERELA